MTSPQPGTGPGGGSASSLDTAIALYSQGRFTEALATTERLLSDEPANALALNVAGAAARAAGNIGAAETYWRRAIATAPRFGEAYNNLGTLLHEIGRPAEAEACYRAALAINPNNPAAHYNLARTDASLGRPDEAESGFRRAIELQPGYVDAWSALGQLLLDTSRGPEAVTYLRRATELAPRNSDAQFNLGTTLLGLGRFEDAIVALRSALTLAPGHLGAMINLANALKQRGLLADAENIMRQAIGVAPGMPQLHWTLGAILQTAGRLTEAEAACRQALALEPADSNALANLGVILRDLGRSDEAEEVLKRAGATGDGQLRGLTNLGVLHLDGGRMSEALTALTRAAELAPRNPDAHFNLGNALKGALRFGEAEASFKAALALAPNHVKALNNLGIVQRETRQIEAAERTFRRALAVDPTFVDARWNLGLTLLATGRLAEGWMHYEARAELPPDARPFVLPELPFPPWQGESLAGKSILVLREQGIGDEIQCARLIPVFRQMGAKRISLVTRPTLAPLFASLGVNLIVPDSETVPIEVHDFWAFAFSATRFLCPTLDSIPAPIPYLGADPARAEAWRSRLSSDGLKIGLVWKGGALHANDRYRSLPGLQVLAPLWRASGVTFHSLQKGQDEGGRWPSSQPMIDLAPSIADFADTAAIIVNLDLVITVDTAVAHLAGALGKKCWVMLPAIDTDWRWLSDRTDSPWYPSVMSLFRQTTPGDWSAVASDMADRLVRLASESR
ncbi:MAG: tetratricopeptide repeat protein [Alphaproteobacteria bacterium]|nr:tetratricopeptide repeat protein [Alphaproteobacteria bacterium]